jgi:hypothetical protein
MPQTPLENVVAHWHKLIESFQTSPKDFYTNVELALDHRYVPGLKTSRVKWSEGGLLSPDREYLRVEGDRHAFDLCAAPFGSGFFLSSWTTQKKARFVPLYLISFALLTLFIGWLLQQATNFVWHGSYGLGMGLVFGLLRLVINPFVLIPLSVLIVLWLIAVAARAGNTGPEAAILTVPLIGWFYERVFAPQTYYRIDTMLMFQSAVHAAMLEAIDGLLTTKGLRALTDEESKPVFREMLYGSGRAPRANRSSAAPAAEPAQPAKSPPANAALTPDGRLLLAMTQGGTSSEHPA